jgi:fatty-acyl-CoA synthase
MSKNPSYVCGLTQQPLLYRTLGNLFADTVTRWGDREAIVVRHQGIRWSYRQLGGEVERVAAGLLALGLEPGDRVGIWSPNNIEWVITQFATARAGLVLVNINPACRKAELIHTLTKVGCKALVFAARFKSSDYLKMLREIAPEVVDGEPGHLALKELPDLRTLVVIDETAHEGMIRFDEVASLATAGDRRRLAELTDTLQPDDPINIQFTSGTTGLPKAATLSHFNILNNAWFTAEAMGFSEQDRLCIPVPLYHCFGMVLSVLACVSHGAAMIFPSEGFDAGETLSAVDEERCTALHGVPTMFIAELEHPDFERFDLSSLRTGIMAGAPCPIEIMRKVIDRMHMAQVTIAYGMTETSPVSFQSAVDDELERRVSTVGRVQPHLQVKIIDEHGRTVERGARGELCTRGYAVMLGYWGDPEQTRATIDRAGWLHSGDLAEIDEAGYCRIVGRVKDMIIRGGENIYPREIEEYLFRHPKIEQVSVFGVPSERYGEEVACWIKLHEGVTCNEQEIRAFCEDQIAHFKVPRFIRFVDEFPMTVTGKIQKFVMRERMQLALSTVDQSQVG